MTYFRAMTDTDTSTSGLTVSDEPRYLSSAFLRRDLKAGLVVFLVALPLCLGIALASGAPLISGLIAGVVGGVVVSILGGSQLSVSGPAAGLTVIVLGAIQGLGFEVFLAAVVVAGLIQIVLGLVRAGTLGHYIPNAVIEGMMAAIGTIIVFKQIPHALGDDLDPEGDLAFAQADQANTFTEILRALGDIHPGALLISGLSVLVLLWYASPRMARPVWLPAPLLIVVLGVGAQLLLGQLGGTWSLGGTHLVQVPQLTGGQALDSLRFPSFGAVMHSQFWVTAVTLAVVASLETLLSVSAVDKLDPWRRRSLPNRELVAQGAANALSGLMGGLPVTAVIVRSATNVSAGGRTKTAAFVHGVLMLLCVLLLPGVLNHIPLASLAIILVAVGIKLAQPKLFVQMYRKGWDQFVIFLVTFLVILFTDLLVGIAAGLGVGVLFILRRSARSLHLNIRRIEGGDDEPTVIRLSDQVSFLQKETFLAELERIPMGSRVVLDATHTQFLDPDIRDIIYEFKEQAPMRNIELELRGFGHLDHQLVTVTRFVRQSYDRLLRNNRMWADAKKQEDAEYFAATENTQAPAYFFLTCCDSRIMVNALTGTDAGEVFIHRNIANQVVADDSSFTSSLQYAVEVLKVQHLIVCGHYRCGGVNAAMAGEGTGHLAHWLSGLHRVYGDYRSELDLLSPHARADRLVELNVLRQVGNLAQTEIVQQAWARGQKLELHGWVYDVGTGLLNDLKVDTTSLKPATTSPTLSN